MLKSTFTRLSAVAVMLFNFGTSTAQTNASILGARLIVESPSSISGQKDFTYSSNGTSAWGGAITARTHEEVAKFSDSLGCSTITGVTGKWALVYRGNCEFGQKALNAQNAGAIGVIIWNHTDNELINMAAGSVGNNVTIPVLFVTKKDGTDMNNQLNNGQQVFISLTNWGFGYANDLAIILGTTAASPGMAVPLNQLSGATSAAYRGYVGAAIANTGTQTQNNVKLSCKVNFTPTSGGTSTPFYSDSAILATFAPGDSIDLISSPRSFNFMPTQTGTYNFQYNVSAAATDQFLFDNNDQFSFAVTNNVFSRSRYDMVNQMPVVTGYSRVNSTSIPWTWGPMIYVRKGGYTMQTLQFALSDQDTSKHSLATSAAGQFIDAYVFKWKDLNNDGLMEKNELSLKAGAFKTFTTSDSVKKMMNVQIGDTIGNSLQVLTEDSSYYWIAVNLGTQFNLSNDGSQNYYMRAYSAKHNSNSSNDFWAPGVLIRKEDLSPSDTIKAIPFGVSTPNSSNIDSASFDQQSAVPSLAFITSMWAASVKPVSNDQYVQLYPNPAINNLNVQIALDKEEDVFVKVMDAMGKQVMLEHIGKTKNSNINVNISSLANGNYYLVIIGENRGIIKSFIKTN
ncbi:MAG: T9SS type A sorting domain-containing protein [Bacteroidetes bacterium]|nr:T9SS type A sorting domain-containing protein [Bacteroidota bacterium]